MRATAGVAVLSRVPRPRSRPRCTAVASGAFMCVLWALRLQPVPQVSWADIKALAPVGALHCHLAAPAGCSTVACDTLPPG